jgi:hypothetical protein
LKRTWRRQSDALVIVRQAEDDNGEPADVRRAVHVVRTDAGLHGSYLMPQRSRGFVVALLLKSNLDVAQRSDIARVVPKRLVVHADSLRCTKRVR